MITNLGRPEVPMGSAMLSKAPGTETAMGNTSNAGVSSLSNEDQMLLEEEKWNELFRNSIKFTKYEGFSSDKSEEREAENISKCKNIRMRWAKEVNKIIIRCFYQSDHQKEGIRNE